MAVMKLWLLSFGCCFRHFIDDDDDGDDRKLASHEKIKKQKSIK